MSAKFCGSCGSAVAPEAAFCPSCGAPIRTAAPPSAAAVMPLPPAPSASGPAHHYQGSPEAYRPRWDRKTILIYVPLFLGGLLYALWMGGLI